MENRLVVKLGNFMFSSVFDHNDDMYTQLSQSGMEEMMKSRDLSSLREIALKVGEHTDFYSTPERETYFEIVQGLTNDTMDAEEDFSIKNIFKPRQSMSERILEFFIESIWPSGWSPLTLNRLGANLSHLYQGSLDGDTEN